MKRAFVIPAILALHLGVGGLFPSSAEAGLILAVGGGGGAGFSGVDGIGGEITTSADSGSGPFGGIGGTGGSGGGGGTNSVGFNGGGGGGYLGAGGDGIGAGPTPQAGGSGDGGFGPSSFAGGLGGGTADGSPTGVLGGFGGGGGGGWQGGGGGGGYSGGGGGDGADFGGGGGGSYYAPLSNVVATAGANGGDGFVTINGLTFFYTGSIVDYTVATTGVYSITAAGAQGGGASDSNGGLGALISGDVTLSAGTTLAIVVGGQGVNGDFGSVWGGGGGGGSFVFTATVPEPSSFVLLATAMSGLACYGRWRRTRS